MEALSQIKDLPTLIAAGVVILCLHLLLKIGELIYRQVEKKGQLSETSIKNLTEALNKNTTEMDRLNCRMEKVEQNLVDIPKIQKDLRRLFVAVKKIAGDEWPNIRKVMMEDEL